MGSHQKPVSMKPSEGLATSFHDASKGPMTVHLGKQSSMSMTVARIPPFGMGCPNATHTVILNDQTQGTITLEKKGAMPSPNSHHHHNNAHQCQVAEQKSPMDDGEHPDTPVLHVNAS